MRDRDESALTQRTLRNWSQTRACTPREILSPADEDALRQILCRVRREQRRLRVAGSLHSGSDIAFQDDCVVRLDGFRRISELDRANLTVLAEAGVTLSELNEFLRTNGFALSNLGSISDQTIAGAISTGTHGTGARFGALHTSVTELQIMLADGSTLKLDSSSPDLWQAFLVSLGCLGVILRVRLRIVPLFTLTAEVENRSLDDALASLDADVAANDHYKLLFYPWVDHVKVWRATRGSQFSEINHPDRKRSRKATRLRPILETLLWASCSAPALVPPINRLFYYLENRQTLEYTGISYEVFNFDCLFRQHVSEWAIPAESAAAALRELAAAIRREKIPAHFPIEVRFVAADDAWLSMAHGRDVCFVGIILYRPFGRDVPREKYWNTFESIMRSYQGRPHWAKENSCTPEYLRSVYPKFDRFLQLRAKLDPQRMFMNDYIERHLLRSQGAIA